MHGGIGVPGREAGDGFVGLGDAGAERGCLGPHLRDDLRGASHLGDRLGEDGGLLVEQVLRPVAELEDARVARTQLLVGVRDLVVVQLVELERFAQVGAHRSECRAQISGEGLAELGFREGELVGGRADPLVGADQGLLSTSSQIGILCGEFFLFAFASAPKSSHDPILVSPGTGMAEHPLGANGDPVSVLACGARL